MKNIITLDSVIKMPFMQLPVKTVIVKLKNALVLISPGSKLHRDQYKNIGDVSDIIGPSQYHCSGVAKAHSVFNKAQAWAAESVEVSKLRVATGKNISATDWPYHEELIAIPLKGMRKVHETVFIHKESRTLIVADLCFNLTQTSGFGAWIILNLFGTYKKFAVSKFFLKDVVDHKAFKSSLKELFAHDFDNIIMGHGDVIEGQGRQLLQMALAVRKIYID